MKILAQCRYLLAAITPVAILLIFVRVCCIHLADARHRLNGDLVYAILHKQNARILGDVRKGADRTCQEGNRPILTTRALFAAVEDTLMLRRHDSAATSDATPCAMLMYYRVYTESAPSSGIPGRGPRDCQLPREDVVLELIDPVVSVQQTDDNGMTALAYAVLFHHHKVVKLLLCRGARVDVRGHDGAGLVAMADSVDSAVLYSGGELMDENDEDLQTPLYSSDPAKAELLLSRGAAIEHRDKNGQTPLTYACTIGNDRLVESLLDHHASVTTHDNLGLTPILRAAAHCRLETIQHLLRKGGSLTERSKQGTTALMLSLFNHDDRVFTWLVSLSTDINAQREDGNTVLTLAEHLSKIGSNRYEAGSRGTLKAAYLRSKGAIPCRTLPTWRTDEGY